MFWNKKKQINSPEYEFLMKRFIELQSQVAELSSKIAVVQTDAANLRGQFSRKLTGLKKEEKDDEMISKNINNPVILPSNGYF